MTPDQAAAELTNATMTFLGEARKHLDEASDPDRCAGSPYSVEMISLANVYANMAMASATLAMAVAFERRGVFA